MCCACARTHLRRRPADMHDSRGADWRSRSPATALPASRARRRTLAPNYGNSKSYRGSSGVYLSIYLSACLSSYLSVCRPVYLPSYYLLATYLLIYISSYLPTYLVEPRHGFCIRNLPTTTNLPPYQPRTQTLRPFIKHPPSNDNNTLGRTLPKSSLPFKASSE